MSSAGIPSYHCTGNVSAMTVSIVWLGIVFCVSFLIKFHPPSRISIVFFIFSVHFSLKIVVFNIHPRIKYRHFYIRGTLKSHIPNLRHPYSLQTPSKFIIGLHGVGMDDKTPFQGRGNIYLKIFMDSFHFISLGYFFYILYLHFRQYGVGYPKRVDDLSFNFAPLKSILDSLLFIFGARF